VALTERNRNALYQGLTRTIGDEEAVEAMLSQFPAREVDEPATKDFVLAVESRIEKEMVEGFADLKEYVHDEMRRWFVWSYGAMFVLLVAVVTVAKILE
jgi:hypothetical protein